MINLFGVWELVTEFQVGHLSSKYVQTLDNIFTTTAPGATIHYLSYPSYSFEDRPIIHFLMIIQVLQSTRVKIMGFII
uniref:Uncharacterized protein n=1 Tax=Acrobeloides nanus TaxID=290746 RepID=A0A914CKN0_9BILA